MTRQWCVPSHEGSVLFVTSSVRCRRTDVKREPLVGQPSTAPQIDFFAQLLAPCKSCAKNAQQRADGFRNRSRAPQAKYCCAITSCADLDAKRTYCRALVGPLASVAKVAALAVGNMHPPERIWVGCAPHFASCKTH